MKRLIAYGITIANSINKYYQEGEVPRQIFDKYGYPADVLGKKRIWGVAHNIKDQYYSEEGLREGSLKRSTSANSSYEITEEAVKQLQNEVQQLRQEIELMKKGAHERDYP